MCRRDLWMLFVVIGGFVLAGVGGVMGLKPLVGIGCLIAGLCVAVGMARTHRGGVIQTSWGINRRAVNPIGFWIEATFWWTVILLWTLGGVLHSSGRL